MGKIKRLLDRFDEMGRYPIQELGYSRTWLMFSYLGAFLVHRWWGTREMPRGGPP